MESVKYKLGDTVRIIANGHSSNNFVGDVGKIIELDNYWARVVVPGRGYFANNSRLHEIELVSSDIDIKVGDWVIYSGALGEKIRLVIDIKGDELYFAENKTSPLKSNGKEYCRKATEKEVNELADPITSCFSNFSTPPYEFHDVGLTPIGSSLAMRDLMGNIIPVGSSYITNNSSITTQINNNSNGSSKENTSKKGEGSNDSDGRRETVIRHEISFGGRGNGLEAGNRERQIRSVEIGKRSRSEGEGLRVGRRSKRSITI